ncbi:MAG: hypothetical protein ACLR7L_08920 [Enterocloster sp.]|uniref:hypothetical protein n=1 Tax=Enterocloster bolteae TaxID=208479 RepID=UPI0012E9B1C8|nr:hypothetical protein [Enterocloster bolteae]
MLPVNAAGQCLQLILPVNAFGKSYQIMLHSHGPVRPPLTKKAAAFQYLRAIKGEKIKI